MDRMTDEAMRDEQKTMQERLAEAQRALAEAQRGRRSATALRCCWMALATVAVVLACMVTRHALDLAHELDRFHTERGWELHQCQDRVQELDAEVVAVRAYDS